MKKILAAVAMAAVVAAGASAFTFEASAGFGYGFSDLTQKDDSNKTERIDNALGVKLEGTLGITDNLGIQLDTAFLWPTKGTTIKVSDTDGNNTTENTIDYDGAFVFNGFIGPVYTFNVNKDFSVKVGAGFDLAFNSYNTVVDDTKVLGLTVNGYKDTYSYMSYGIGATVDADYMVNKNMGVKVGLTFGYLWGNQYQYTHAVNEGDTSTSTKDFEANGLYLIPDFSFVYKF